jgi:anti-anti-sigma regulatory factor
MFQVRRSEDKGLVTFSLSGRIEEEQVAELQKLLEVEAGGNSIAVVLDLADVRLVYREAVKFLADCEAGGVELRNCPPYVREWIEKGKGQRHEP